MAGKKGPKRQSKSKPAAPRKSTKSTPEKSKESGGRRDWTPAFLASLAETGNVTAAARAASIDRTTAYHRRDLDPAFAAAMAEALEVATDDLEGEARRRAKDGVEKPVFQGGEQVGTVREYSDTLLIFLLKAHRPEKYRERYDIKHGGNVNVNIRAEELSDDELADIASGGGGRTAPPPAGADKS